MGNTSLPCMMDAPTAPPTNSSPNSPSGSTKPICQRRRKTLASSIRPMLAKAPAAPPSVEAASRRRLNSSRVCSTYICQAWATVVLTPSAATSRPIADGSVQAQRANSDLVLSRRPRSASDRVAFSTSCRNSAMAASRLARIRPAPATTAAPMDNQSITASTNSSRISTMTSMIMVSLVYSTSSAACSR